MDTPVPGLWLIVIVILIFVNVFFSLSETSLLESHKSRLEKMADDGDKEAEEALKLLEYPSKVASVLQIGITLIGILLGVSTSMLLAPYLAELIPLGEYAGQISLVIGIVVVTYLTLMFSEFLPRRIAMEDPERTLIHCQRTLKNIMVISAPFTMVLSGTAKMMLNFLGVSSRVDDTVTEDEVKDLIEQGMEDGTFERTERTMVDRVFHMSDQTAYSLMTPRTQMLWLDLEDSNEHNLKVIRDNPDSVIPVGKESLDDFCGVIYTKDLLDAVLANRPLELAQFIKKPMFISRSMESFRILEQFNKTGIHEAVVMDEYGGGIGFITIHDIMMELIGDISAINEPEPMQIIQRDDTSWFIDGMCSIDDFKEKFDIDQLPDEEEDHFQTMGGFVTSQFGYLPAEQESVEWDEFSFKVLKMDRYRLDRILCTKIKKPEEAAEA